MTINNYKCKCGNDSFYFMEKGSQIGLYCDKCGKWLKWADKDERNLMRIAKKESGKTISVDVPLIEHLSILNNLAIIKDPYYDESKYQWVLGVNVLNDIVNEREFMNHKDAPMTLFGIRVLRDYSDPTNIQLWKNITSDL